MNKLGNNWLICCVSALWVSGGCGIVHFVDQCIAVLVIKDQNDWCAIWRPQVAMHRNCHLL